jgi:formamidopyrimidine-DNA glycosylase
MPELPEVETIRCGLEPKLGGQTIKDVSSDSPRHLNYPLRVYQGLVKGKKIKAVLRRAKIIYFQLSDKSVVAFHLKMTGQLIYKDKKSEVIGGHPNMAAVQDLPNKYTHVTFTFSSGAHLYFNDIRRFGWAKFYTNEQFDEELKKLDYGPEPLTKDFNEEFLAKSLAAHPNTTVKQLLTNQHIIAGIGNIYADEVLFAAKVKPQRKAGGVKKEEITRIVTEIKKILPLAISCGGSSISDYINADGKKGSYADYHQVYGRYDEPCFVCKRELKRITIGGRTSTFCSHCQK